MESFGVSPPFLALEEISHGGVPKVPCLLHQFPFLESIPIRSRTFTATYHHRHERVDRSALIDELAAREDILSRSQQPPTLLRHSKAVSLSRRILGCDLENRKSFEDPSIF